MPNSVDKQAIRERVWDDLESAGVARFPFPPHDRIPNFAGADEAAARLEATDEWQEAAAIKSNPDSPQLPVRRAALRAGKTVYMAVPRLSDEACFMELDPSTIDDTDAAATISSADEYARRVGPDEMPEIDLIVSGSVAVTEGGARIGKGEGYSDLEFAILREFDLVDDGTPVATTVHERQLVEAAPIGPNDVPMDLIATPERLIRTDAGTNKPDGLDWDALSEDRLTEIPILGRLRPDC